MSQGSPLPYPVRSHMEGLFGEDFSDVRVHHDHSATLINARSYTLGDHIYFAPGQYSPNTTTRRRLIAHELAHVIEQRAAAAAQTLVDASGGYCSSDDEPNYSQ